MPYYKLRSGEAVTMCAYKSMTDEVKAILDKVLENIQSRGRPFIVEEIPMDNIKGKSSLVKTNPNDAVFFAKRISPNGTLPWGHSRLVLGKEPEITNIVTVVLEKSPVQEYLYILKGAYFGKKIEPEPWNKSSFAKKDDPEEAKKNSIAFWRIHAFIAELTPFQRETACRLPPKGNNPSR